MFNTPATLLCDFYKLSHRECYPKGTEVVYSTWTPRTSRIDGITKVVAFGFQGFIKKYLIDYFNQYFFNQPLESILLDYTRVVKYSLGIENPETSHIEALHKLGYMPLEIKAVEEGTLVPIRVPMLSVRNTEPEFFWLTNYLETLFSCSLWQPITSATIALEYKKILSQYAEETGNVDFVPFQGHDFSMRGMSSLESAEVSGAGHLTSFIGTDTIPAINYLENYYFGDAEKYLLGVSIPATEHSVMCAYGQENEFDLFKKLITEIYPSGLFSVVSDTWDFWQVVGEYLPKLKEEILSRDGKVVIRPDSGVPEDILCGSENGVTELEQKGLIESLWDIFGGSVNEKGYKELDPHIGAIYGDAITIERCKTICERLKQKGFASTNVVYGIGSYTYQYNTRDTFGFAMKATYVVVNGEERMIFKDPKTDNGVKKSQRGLVAIVESDNGLTCVDNLLQADYELLEQEDLMKTIFYNGDMVANSVCDIDIIRQRIAKTI